VVRLIRIFGAAVGALIGLGLASIGEGLFLGTPNSSLLLAAWVAAWVTVGAGIIPYFTTVPATWLITHVQELSTAEFITAVAGIILGLLMGLLLGLPLSGLGGPLGTWLPIGVSIFLGLGMLGLTVAKRQGLAHAAEALGLVRRAGDSTEGPQRVPIVVDTSAIIDGRIAEIVESGFLYGALLVPRFVLDELQGIADASDSLKRARGRRGLEILAKLEKDSPVPLTVVTDEIPNESEVDAKLVVLAKARGAGILTTDFNLNRIAEVQGVRVLNVNALANALKPALLPGEAVEVRVIQEGKEAGQGVGFLDDGTMIVVEGGARMLNQDVEVTVTRVLQTVAGRMIFGQPRDAGARGAS
jgi:uncharacterized protein YacL